MNALTSADCGKALAMLDALASGKPKAITDAGLRVEDVTAAALTFVRARLAADKAHERRTEADRVGGWHVYGLQAMGEMEIDCDRLDDDAIDAYHALVAPAAGASAEVAP